MEGLAQIFETNNFIVYSTYGQVFFVMGIAAALHLRTRSRLLLARSLWLLAGFGVLHALNEWGHVFIPVQSSYLPASVTTILWLVHGLLGAVSFLLLFQFGVELVWPSIGWRWIRVLPMAVFALWVFLFLYVGTYIEIGVTRTPGESLFAGGHALSRYLLALPGGAFAALGLHLQARTVEAMDLTRIARYLRYAAVAFLLYAVLAGLVVPPADFFPANTLNTALVRRMLGVPVPIFRSLAGLAIAYFVVRALEVFAYEMERLIAGMERAQMLARERERIGRELHDGTIQTIYAAGLALEDVVHTIGEDPSLAQSKTRQVMGSLDRSIGDIRRYILDLNTTMANREFEAVLDSIARDCATAAGLSASLRVESEWRRPLSADQTANLVQVAREACSNAAKHARASRLDVVLDYQRDEVLLRVTDNGRGFSARWIARKYDLGRGQGLRNIAHRLEALGGSLRIESRPGSGTWVTASVPYTPAEKAG